MKRIIALLASIAAVVFAVVAASPAQAAPPVYPCKVEVKTWTTVDFWASQSTSYRFTETDCVLPRPARCIKLERTAPTPHVILPESCSPTSA